MLIGTNQVSKVITEEQDEKECVRVREKDKIKSIKKKGLEAEGNENERKFQVNVDGKVAKKMRTLFKVTQ